MSLFRSLLLGALALASLPVLADENLFGYVRGAETLPKGARELYQHLTVRTDKGAGHYRALDAKTEFEYGVTDRFSASAELKAQGLNTSGILIDGYMPGDEKYTLKASGVEFGAKVNLMSPAKDDFGLATLFGLSHHWLDPHSGRKKDTTSIEGTLIGQKYFLEGQMTWAGNLGVEATYARRKPIDNLPAGFEWSTDPEVEIELKAGTALAYRFMPNWSVGAEALYETEFETEVGQERWSVFGGPTLHYGGQKWWATLSLMRQVRGGGEKFDAQRYTDLHLIEKTRNEVRLKVGYNF
ncbi:MAG: DUF6662 family protein [Pseudomonadota bacterium]